MMLRLRTRLRLSGQRCRENLGSYVIILNVIVSPYAKDCFDLFSSCSNINVLFIPCLNTISLKERRAILHLLLINSRYCVVIKER